MALGLRKIPLPCSPLIQLGLTSSTPKPNDQKWALITWRCFHESYREGDARYVRPDNRSTVEKIRQELASMKGEVKLWKQEMREKFLEDPKFYLPGDTDILWDFDTQEKLGKWIVTSDKDNNDGYSECEFIHSKTKKGLFRGTLSTRLPQDGMLQRTGYCNITARKARKSFMRESHFDWSPFTHLVLRLRGDGRSYMVNLLSSGSFDITWHDTYSFVLYTRGGPYWQTAKLPFSRFYLNSKGVIQDKQARVPLVRISSLGITCADKVPGDFQLEIDYIGAHLDGNFTEQFAYEKYVFGKYLLW